MKPLQAAAGSQTGNHRQQQHSQNVIEYRRTQDDAGGGDDSTPRSPSTRAVMPTLVATMAAPTKIASLEASPRSFM